MKNQPALKAALLLSLGILASRFEHVPFHVVWIAVSLMLLCLLLLFYGKKTGPIFQILLLLSVFLLGVLREYQRAHLFPPDHILHFVPSEAPIHIRGFLLKDPVDKNQRTEFLVDVDSICIGNREIKSCGGILVSSYSDLPVSLKYGDEITVFGSLERPAGQRNPGGFDYRAYLERKGIYAVLRIKGSFAIQGTGNKKGNWILRKWIYPARRYILRVINRTTAGQSRALLKALIIGERGEVFPEVRDDFAKAGVIHVLAVSGLHVGFVVMIFLTIFGLFRFPYLVRILLTIAGLIFYVLLTEAKAPVARASIMCGLYLFGTLFERRPDPFNIMGLAGLVLLLINPLDLFDLGFQLSFAAVFSIVFFYQKINALPFIVKIKNNLTKYSIGRYILPAFLVSLSAQLGTLPLIAVYFNRIPLLALVINLIAVPAAGLIVALGFTSIIFSLFSFWIASVYGALNQEIIRLFIGLIHWFGKLPFSYIEIPSPGMILIMLYFSFLLLLLQIHDSRRRKQFLFAVVVFSNLWIWEQVIRNDSNKLTWIQFDVGQGDTALIRLPRGKTVLIDGGEKRPRFDNGERVVAPYLRKQGIRKLDLVILTHPHNDHVGGLTYILNHFLVSSIITAGTAFNSGLYSDFLNTIEKCGIPHTIVTAPDSLFFPGIKMFFLSPTREIKNSDRNVNNQSVVVRIIYGRIRLLFMGDAERAIEKSLVSQKLCLQSDGLKVGHHGSITSSTRPFLERVAPEFAVISVGRYNRFGHPSDIVLQRFRDMNADVFRTDREGAVIFRTDGTTLRKINW